MFIQQYCRLFLLPSQGQSSQLHDSDIKHEIFCALLNLVFGNRAELSYILINFTERNPEHRRPSSSSGRERSRRSPSPRYSSRYRERRYSPSYRHRGSPAGGDRRRSRLKKITSSLTSLFSYNLNCIIC